MLQLNPQEELHDDVSKYYPLLVYPHISIIDALECLLQRKRFLEMCNEWQKYISIDQTKLCDGKLWQEFSQFSFLSHQNGLAFMLNIDWFQPYKHCNYSIGVIYYEPTS